MGIQAPLPEAGCSPEPSDCELKLRRAHYFENSSSFGSRYYYYDAEGRLACTGGADFGPWAIYEYEGDRIIETTWEDEECGVTYTYRCGGCTVQHIFDRETRRAVESHRECEIGSSYTTLYDEYGAVIYRSGLTYDYVRLADGRPDSLVVYNSDSSIRAMYRYEYSDADQGTVQTMIDEEDDDTPVNVRVFDALGKLAIEYEPDSPHNITVFRPDGAPLFYQPWPSTYADNTPQFPRGPLDPDPDDLVDFSHAWQEPDGDPEFSRRYHVADGHLSEVALEFLNRWSVVDRLEVSGLRIDHCSERLVSETWTGEIERDQGVYQRTDYHYGCAGDPVTTGSCPRDCTP